MDRNFENVQYYEKHRSRVLAHKAFKIRCECGTLCAKGGIARHRKTDSHKRTMAAKVITRFIRRRNI